MTMRFAIIDSATNKEIQPDGKKRVGMLDGQKFKVEVVSRSVTRLQFDLYMNGKVGDADAHIGTWILRPFQRSVFERGGKNSTEFTFKADGNDIDLSKLIDTKESNWGLVSARFRDEFNDAKLRQFDYPSSLGGDVLIKSIGRSPGVHQTSLSYNDIAINSGGIVGSGHSNQEFGTTHGIKEYGTLDVIYAVRLYENKFSKLTEPKAERPIPSYDYP